MKIFIRGFLVIIALLAAFVFYSRTKEHDYVNPEINLEVTSPAFRNGGIMPARYSGRGEDLSPPINLGELDGRAKTIAIIMDDLDHPLGVFNHWVIWNIPSSFSDIPEGIAREEAVASLGNAVQGKSAYGGKHYYRGPKPPFGTHKYIFKVYVLDTALELDKDAGKAELQKAMEGHILQYGTLTGSFGE